jgi:hypothetical protein
MSPQDEVPSRGQTETKQAYEISYRPQDCYSRRKPDMRLSRPASMWIVAICCARSPLTVGCQNNNKAAFVVLHFKYL